MGHKGARYDAIRFRDHTVRQGVLALPIIAPDVQKALFTNKGQAHSAAMMALVIEVKFQIAILPLWVFQNGIQSTGAALEGKTSSIFDEIVVPASEWKILRDKVREALRQIPPRCAGSEAMNDRTPLAGPVRPRRKLLSRSPMLRHTEAQGSRPLAILVRSARRGRRPGRWRNPSPTPEVSAFALGVAPKICAFSASPTRSPRRRPYDRTAE